MDNMSEKEPVLVAPIAEGAAGEVQYKLVNTPEIDYGGCVWSLAVIKLLCDGEVESRLVYDVARERELALTVAETLCRNCVTPCCVTEVLDDLLGNI